MTVAEVRRRVAELAEECTTTAKRNGVTMKLLYSGITAFPTATGYMFLGANPGGDDEAAQFDDLSRALGSEPFSAYADEGWWQKGSSQPLAHGAHAMQRRVQEVARLLAGDDLVEIRAARNTRGPASQRLSSPVLEFLRNTPSGNLIPYRSSSRRTLDPRLKSDRTSGEELIDLASPAVLILLGTGDWAHIVRRLHREHGTVVEERPARAIDEKLHYQYRTAAVISIQSPLRMIVGLPAFNYRPLSDSNCDRILDALADDLPDMAAAVAALRA